MILLNGSKQNTEYVVNLLVNLLKTINFNNKFIAGMVAMFHIIFGVFILTNICLCKINTFYNCIIILWLLIIISNYYFHGCLLTRIERNLLISDNWYGPASIFLKCCNIPQNKNNANNVIKYLIAAPFSTIMITRVFLAKKYYLVIFLFLLLTPLLFINSQATLFNNICINEKNRGIDLKNMNIVVTGTSSGIGFNLTNKLLASNANVICLMRNSYHARKIYKNFKNIYKNKIQWVKVDYNSLTTVKDAIKYVKTIYNGGIDVLFNNIGITNTLPKLSKDGYESQMQINCLSHIMLTEGLIFHIQKRNGVIINNSSMSYNIPNSLYNPLFYKKYENVENNIFKKTFISQYLYQQSKLGLVLYTKSLQYRFKNIRCVSFHPSICKTNLFNKTILPWVIIKIINIFSIDIDTVIQHLLNCIINSKVNDINVMYGPSNICIDNNLSNNIQVKNFYKDVVCNFVN